MTEERVKSYVANIPIVAKKFKVGRILSCGSFGVLCEGKNIVKNEKVAIKFELRDEENRFPQLAFEFNAYDRLNRDGNETGIPKLYYFKDIPGMPVHALVMELLGPSLESMFNKCDRQFSVKTTLLIAEQLIERMQFVHSCGLINRDIKPDNFLLGRPGTENARTIYMIDFGLCKPYKNNKGRHIQKLENNNPFGTVRYMSVNCHKRITLSRRDDLESLGYTLIYFYKGQLPWQGITSSDPEERNSQIASIKEKVSIHRLCEGLPEAFTKYLRYVKDLGFAETPDYHFMKKLFRQAFHRGRFENELFDWEL